MVGGDKEHRKTEGLKSRLDDALQGNLQPPGTIMLYAGQVPPTDWGICDGAALERETYPHLFEVIGERFGNGDGETTFNLPNLQRPAEGIHYIIRLGSNIPATKRKPGPGAS
ncbi:MAG: tail fiber protein [Chloroflexi bacterium]|nr:tail fiber protein [Chloroflexota bacterium]